MEKDIRVLCRRCANEYRDAGYILKSTGYQAYQQDCFKCDRRGYEYEVWLKNGRDNSTTAKHGERQGNKY
jgi:hypothetical protein